MMLKLSIFIDGKETGVLTPLETLDDIDKKIKMLQYDIKRRLKC